VAVRRIGGGEYPRLVHAATGLDIAKATVLAALDTRTNIDIVADRQHRRMCAVPESSKVRCGARRPPDSLGELRRSCLDATLELDSETLTETTASISR
jgi:hypothetical protein